MIGMGRKMEWTRKLRLSAMNICRFCLTSDSDLHSLYEDPGHNNKLHLQILSCLSVEVFPSDHMPRFICDRCKSFMKTFYAYKQICRQADETIMKHIQKGTPLRSISFPPSLRDVFSKEVKALTGTTVQVSLQGGTDSDEDVDENVYNIKMGVGSEDDGAQVTVIPSNQDNKNRLSKEQNNDGFQCNFCEKNFVKYAHFIRHVENKHHHSCDQCGEKFVNQDDLIYHSAIHATQNLTCPLCMEKFENVDEVTTHIKSHVNASEFMCDFCELVFMTNDKLEAHLVNSHKAELQQAKQDMGLDESSMENRGEDDDDEDNGIRVKQVGDEMVVEINKPDSFMLNNSQDEMEKGNNFSEDSEADSNHPDMLSDIAVITKLPVTGNKHEPINVLQNVKLQDKEGQTVSILKKAEEIKRKVLQKPVQSAADRKQKPVAKPENVMSASNDKSLRLLEKELQELKRTNTKAEVVKTPAKSLESIRSRRPQLATSTPKPKPIEERKVVAKAPVTLEKKPPEKRVVTKENKEPKDSKVSINDKELKDKEEEKEELEKDKKAKKEVDKDVKEIPKTAFKNGASEKEKAEEVIRRSNRPSKIKDYAKLVRDKPQNEEDDSEEDDDDEEYTEEKTLETRKRRSSQKATIKPTPTRQPTPATNTGIVRKRGRPRKDESLKEYTPAKMKKEEPNQNETEEMDTSPTEKEAKPETEDRNATPDIPETKSDPKPLLVSPSGQTLKQVPMKSLPPGVKPLPLPLNARQVGTSEVCEMQIGKKVVKVQKIMMTKAEVEAMAKKGLVEFKDGTMVLKQGIKLPTAVDPATLKTTLVGDAVTNKESPKKETAPTRSDLEDAA